MSQLEQLLIFQDVSLGETCSVNIRRMNICLLLNVMIRSLSCMIIIHGSIRKSAINSFTELFKLINDVIIVNGKMFVLM